uniref:Uncharacterized protein MANES_15G042000 n=1 Tax=Rhizophora mucronata TaxID=61149 RepID=A0A2P2JVG3_RHIMU
MALGLPYMGITCDIGLQMCDCLKIILILKDLTHCLEMGALQRGLVCQAASQAHRRSLVRFGQAGCSQAVAVCPQPRGSNQGLNPSHHLLLEPQLPEAAVMAH